MLETNLLARLIDAARTVMPLTPVNAATLALTQLPLGQTVRAQVTARHADGTFRLVINDAPLKLALPADAKAGDVVTLRLVAREPQLQFVLERPSASAEARLSSGARLIGQILSDPAPLRPTLGPGEAAVERADLAGKASVESIQQLGCQRDFRDQHETATPKLVHSLHGTDVNFGLAAAGYAMEQERFKAAGGDAT